MSDQKKSKFEKKSVDQMQKERENIAAFFLARVVDAAEIYLGIPKPGTPSDGLSGEDIESRAELIADSQGYSGQYTKFKLAIGNGLATIAHAMSLPHKLKLTSGSTTLVADLGRRDLLETLIKLQNLLGDGQTKDLCIVKQPATIEEVARYCAWTGTVFEFRPGYNPGAITADYLAWHPSADYEPRDNLAGKDRHLCKIRRVEHRAES